MGENRLGGELAGQNCPDCGSALLLAPGGYAEGEAGSPVARRGYCPRCDHMHPLRPP